MRVWPFCDKNRDPVVQIPAFYLFYGDLPSAITTGATDEFIARQPGRSVIGISTAADFVTISEETPSALLQTRSGEVVCWRLDQQ